MQHFGFAQAGVGGDFFELVGEAGQIEDFKGDEERMFVLLP
ncbi:hypothetical protein [Neisseria sp. Dent CA1/247]|nr:hypothetical protein [Neisseria sp. Dent CA1/247]